jgi:zinc transporter ZupT
VILALSFAAGGFIYIAGSDLVPELHRSSGVRSSVSQTSAIVFGFFIMFLLTLAE